MSFTVTFSSFTTVSDFTPTLQADYKQSIITASNATEVDITSITAGSVKVLTTAYFSSSDAAANTAAATSLAKTLATDATSIFPTSTYGTVTVSGITETSSTSGKSLPNYVLLWPWTKAFGHGQKHLAMDKSIKWS